MTPHLIDLNRNFNHGDVITLGYAAKALNEFDGPIYGVEMGIAYGGEMESIGKMWKGRGTIYGFDTFEDLHPKHLAKQEFEGNCMDWYYTHEDYGKDKLRYAYQREELDKLGLDNVVLIKGEVKLDSCKDIPYINYAFLDMDIYESMKNGYEAIKEKMVIGGYMLVHDAHSINHITSLYNLFHEEIQRAEGWMWTEPKHYNDELMIMMRKK